MGLAAQLPFDHRFAGGYPRLGGQPLPSDPDAIDYLERVKAADGGVGVEVAVAVAVDDFIKGLKADGLWDAIRSSCLLCGPRTLAGALVPLRGDAPTAYGGWASGDFDRSTGMKGDGNALYLDTNFPANSTDSDDHHASVYLTAGDNLGHIEMGYTTATSYVQFLGNDSNNRILYYLGRNSSTYVPSGIGLGNATGFVGLTADSTSSFGFRFNETTGTATAAATQSLEAENYFVFARNNAGTADVFAESRLAFYSIGTAVDLAKLDAHVSDYVTAIGAAI